MGALETKDFEQFNFHNIEFLLEYYLQDNRTIILDRLFRQWKRKQHSNRKYRNEELTKYAI